MLIKLLQSKSDKKDLIELMKLLALSDKPLLWDGKTSDEITSDTALTMLSIQEGELERELIADYEKSIDPGSHGYGKDIGKFMAEEFRAQSEGKRAKERLIRVLKTFPVDQVVKPESRAQAATTVLKELLVGKHFNLPSPPKIMLFELMLVALCDGKISSIEWTLLKEFQHNYLLDDFIFDDLLERAETLNQEVSKTISIILE